MSRSNKKSRAKNKKNKANAQVNRVKSTDCNGPYCAKCALENQVEKMCREFLRWFRPLNQIHHENKFLDQEIIPTNLTELLEDFIIPTLYTETLDKIRAILDGERVFVTITTSCNGHNSCGCCIKSTTVVNVTIGTLRCDRPGQAFIINSVERELDYKLETGPRDYYANLFTESLVCAMHIVHLFASF